MFQRKGVLGRTFNFPRLQWPCLRFYQFIYRLTVCPELCLGLFIEQPDTKDQARLIGHVIATRVSVNRVIDASMEMPSNWNGGKEAVADGDQVIGNDPNGLYVGVHSLAISPDYQGMGVGRALMDEYVQYVGASVTSVKSIVIIAHDHLIRFYESFGFKNLGPSPCAFGGGGWYDMVCSRTEAFITWAVTDSKVEYRSWVLWEDSSLKRLLMLDQHMGTLKDVFLIVQPPALANSTASVKSAIVSNHRKHSLKT